MYREEKRLYYSLVKLIDGQVRSPDKKNPYTNILTLESRHAKASAILRVTKLNKKLIIALILF